MGASSLFDSSSRLNLGDKIDAREFKDIVYFKLQEILKRVFSDNKEKQRIKVSRDTYQFACPFCRDSASVSSKKRGNFIFKEGAFHNCYKCFNCGHFMSIERFFAHFDETLPLNVIEYLADNKPSKASETKQIAEYTECMFNANEMEELAIPKEDLIKNFGLDRISLDTTAGRYLYSRCVRDYDNILFDNRSNSILLLNCINDKVISFQIRNITPNYKGQKYLTVSLKDIHEKLFKDGKIVSETLNSLSMIYNLYNINPRKPVLATEGPIDGLFLPNCVAILGASKNVNIGIPLWYVFDSDMKGREESIKKLNKGCHVFLWGKLKSIYNLPSRKKWDVNDFVIWCNKYGKDVPKYWSSFFSDDSLDIMDV